MVFFRPFLPENFLRKKLEYEDDIIIVEYCTDDVLFLSVNNVLWRIRRRSYTRREISNAYKIVALLLKERYLYIHIHNIYFPDITEDIAKTMCISKMTPAIDYKG